MRRVGGPIAAVTFCAMALVATASLGAGSAVAADWKLQTHIEGEDTRPNVPILGISCPSPSFCVAVGELGKVISSVNPTGGGPAWDQVVPTGEAETDCHQSWIPPCQPPSHRTIRGVSCPSPQLCVAVTGEGFIYSSTRPTGSGDAWKVVDADGNGRDTHLLGVSCPTASLCVAVSGERYTAGKVLTATNPTGGAAAWTLTQLDETLDLRGVSCGTPTLCVAVAEHGRMIVSTDPTGGASAWKELGTPGGGEDLQGISCAAALLCVAGNSGGNLLASTKPLAASSWEETDGGVSVQVTGVSCLPSRQCVAVDNNGDVLASTDPTDRGSWSLTRLIPYEQPAQDDGYPLNGLFGVSCSSSSFCALVAADGQIFTSTEPFAAPSAPDKGGKRKRRGPRRPRTTIADLFLPSTAELRDLGHGRVIVRFFANGPVGRFECRINHRPAHTCHSPARFKVGKRGTFAIRIRAVGLTGLHGPAVLRRFFTGTRCSNGRCYSPAGELPLPHPHHH